MPDDFICQVESESSSMHTKLFYVCYAIYLVQEDSSFPYTDKFSNCFCCSFQVYTMALADERLVVGTVS